ncbi:excitatory amino acid transporter 3 [Brachionus plicatilis]|uniref:Amino acid transporter n=1 Tax=Brachionus plicatilis TaxID=10195 RepID=A0A3M7SPD6_BRAPC|nr:excitatory amino acid transporter 3 [Brachionus plicatilis]
MTELDQEIKEQIPLTLNNEADVVLTPVKNIKAVFKEQLKENVLFLATIAGVVLGITLGFILRQFFTFNDNQIAYFGFFGQLFLRMLKFLILPLIATSLISGIAGLGSNSAGKIAARALTYYFSTTMTAVVMGIILVVIIQPGSGKSSDVNQSFKLPIDTSKYVTTHDTLLDLVRNLFPDNIIEMAFREYETTFQQEYKYHLLYSNGTNRTLRFLPSGLTNSSELTIIKEFDFYKAVGGSRRSLNVLGIIVFCFVFGGVVASMGKEGEILVKIFEALNNCSVKMIKLVMIISPLGIFSLIVATVIEMRDPSQVFARISMYMVTVILGLAIHAFVILPTLYVVVTRKNVFKFAKNMFDALFIAVATASSTAALPTTFECIEEKNKINRLISRFVLPVGATINMDGTALYEAVAVIFIAQLNDRKLEFIDLVVTSLTATLAAIGAASVPSAGLVTMLIVLGALNLPTHQISLIYTVDWFLDRLRTTVNVWGDSVGAGIIDHLSRKEIEAIEMEHRKHDENNELNQNQESAFDAKSNQV